jgi:hypothetical protein
VDNGKQKAQIPCIIEKVQVLENRKESTITLVELRRLKGFAEQVLTNLGFGNKRIEFCNKCKAMACCFDIICQHNLPLKGNEVCKSSGHKRQKGTYASLLYYM